MKTIDIRLRPATWTSKFVAYYHLDEIPSESEAESLIYDRWDGTVERACLHLVTPRGVFDVEVNELDEDGYEVECLYSDVEVYDTYYDLTTVDESALSASELKKLKELTKAIQKMDDVKPWSYDEKALRKMIKAIADRNQQLADHFVPEYLKLSSSMRMEDYREGDFNPDIILIADQVMDNYDMHFKVTIGDKEKFSWKKLRIIGIRQDDSAYSTIFGDEIYDFENGDGDHGFAWIDAIVYDGKVVVRSYWDISSYGDGRYAIVDKDLHEIGFKTKK